MLTAQLIKTIRCTVFISIFSAYSCLQAADTFLNFTDAMFTMTIAFEGDSAVWTGSNGGVVRWRVEGGTPLDGQVVFMDKKDYRRFSSADGLAANNSYANAIDSTGNVWFGTWDGVSVYDGQNIVTLTDDADLSHEHVTSIAVDRDGIVWCGTGWKGIKKYDGNSWGTIDTSDGLPSNSVASIVADNDGSIWISYGEAGYGVSNYDGQSWQTYTTVDGLAHEKVNLICIDSNGNKWFGTMGGGISRYDGQSWMTINSEDGLPNDTLLGLALNSIGDIYVCTADKKVHKYDGENWTFVYDGLGCIAVDALDRVWISWFGITMWDGTIWRAYAHDLTVAHNDLECIAIDEAGNKWFGDTGSGLLKFNGFEWDYFINGGNLGDPDFGRPGVTGIAFEPNGISWYTTKGSGLWRYDGEDWSNYSASDGLLNDSQWAVAVDQEGKKWIGTESGVSVYDGVNWQNYTEADGLVDNFVWDILIDREGVNWFATAGGISRYDGQQWTSYTTVSGTPINEVNVIAQDSIGHLWFGTGHRQFAGGVGVLEFDGANWIIHDLRDKLIVYGNEGYGIAIDGDNNKWIGTQAGLLKYDGNQWTTYYSRDGLGSNHIKDVEVDCKGNIWYTTGSGGAGVIIPDGNAIDLTGCGTLGDINLDGRINIFDLLDLLKVISGKSEASPPCDTDSNGKVDIFDLLALLKMLK